MIFRLSQKLAKKIKADELRELPLHNNPYADWSSHVFVVNRTQYILLCNTPSLYSCVMYGSGTTSDDVFINRAMDTLREFMADDGQLFAYQKFIVSTMATVSFAKTLNRSVTGSMNELILAAQHALVSGAISPHDVGFDLNDSLLSAIAADKAEGYVKPREAFKRLRIESCDRA